jgi:glycogen debranching enzyme
VACHPQAWASGSIPFALEALLGLTPDGFGQRIRIVRPVLPTFVDRLAVARLRVGRARVDLLFERRSDGGTHADVTNREGQLDVLIED